MYSPADGGAPTKINVYDFKGSGVALAMYNTDDVRSASRCAVSVHALILMLCSQSIRGFAHSSFKMALQKKLPLVSVSPSSSPPLHAPLSRTYIYRSKVGRVVSHVVVLLALYAGPCLAGHSRTAPHPPSTPGPTT